MNGLRRCCLVAGWLAVWATAQQAAAQWNISANMPVVIDFDSTVAGVNNGTYQASGFATDPSMGYLDDGAWAVTGWSDGNLAFGTPSPLAKPNDFARGQTHMPVVTAGIYAYSGQDVPTSTALEIQPGQSDWVPGTLTLKVHNTTGQTITGVDFSYLLYIRNDQDRSSNFNFSGTAPVKHPS